MFEESHLGHLKFWFSEFEVVEEFGAVEEEGEGDVVGVPSRMVPWWMGVLFSPPPTRSPAPPSSS